MIAGAETPQARLSASTWSLLCDGGALIAAVLAILVVRAVTERQESRAARVAGHGAPPATGVVTESERPAALANVTVWPPIEA